MCSSRAVADVGGPADSRRSASQAAPSRGRASPWRRSRRRRSRESGASPLDQGVARAGEVARRACCRRPGPRPARSRQPRRPRAASRVNVACRMLMTVDLGDAGGADGDQDLACSAREMQRRRRPRARAGVSCFEVVDAAGQRPRQRQRRNDHRSRDDRPGERPAPGLVDARDEAADLALVGEGRHGESHYSDSRRFGPALCRKIGSPPLRAASAGRPAPAAERIW